MKKQITRISPHQSSKVMAVLYVIFTLPLAAVGVIALLAGYSDGHHGFNPWFMVGAPLIYGLVGYVFCVVGCWIYNAVARRIGGIEFTVTDLADD